MKRKADIQYQNFKKALSKLEEFAALPVAHDRDEAGVIQAFEFTFEQCWKFFQKKTQDQGELAPGPKPAIEAAFRYGWIRQDSEKHWLQMLEDRNLSAHTYKEELAHDVYLRVVTDYLKLFKIVQN